MKIRPNYRGTAGHFTDALVASEIAQLHRGDVPYFECRLDSVRLRVERTRGIAAFKKTPREHCLEKVSEITQADIQEQVSLLEIAIGNGPPVPNYLRHAPTESVPQMLTFLARLVVDQAFEPSGAARWLTLRGDVSGSDLRVFVGDRSYFAGDAGILLALQAYDSVVHDAKVAAFLDRQALNWLPEVVEVDDVPVILGFSGLGGALLAADGLLQLAPSRWSHLLGWINQTVCRIDEDAVAVKGGDVIAGTAGLMIALASHRRSRSSSRPRHVRLLESIRANVATAASRNEGLLFLSGSSASPLGYAHGWAGVCVSMLAGLKSTESSIYEDVLMQAATGAADFITRNGGALNPVEASYPADDMNLSWCNGAAGFLRGSMARGLPRVEELDQHTATIFLKMNARVGKLDDLRFCCGDMGVVDLLLDVGLAARSSYAYDTSIMAGNAVLQRAVAGIKNGTSTPELAFPGLFQNLSGILYTGCRLLNPALRSLSGQASTDLDCAPIAAQC